MKKEITRPAWRNNVCSMRANEWGQIVSTWGETSSQRTSVGRKCLLIICVGVSADRWLGGRECRQGWWALLVSHQWEWNTLWGGEEWSEAESHRLSEGIVRKHSIQKRRVKSERERHRWAGRQWQREGGKAVTFPRPYPSACSTLLAVPWSVEGRLLKPSLRLHV